MKNLHGLNEFLDISEHIAVDKHLKLISVSLPAPMDNLQLFDEHVLPCFLSTCKEAQADHARKHDLCIASSHSL